MLRQSATQEHESSLPFDELLASIRKIVGRPRRLMLRLRKRAVFRFAPTPANPQEPEFDWRPFDRAMVRYQTQAVSLGTVVWARLIQRITPCTRAARIPGRERR